MSGRRLIEQLARQHADHLRWLRSRTNGRLAPDEAEDILQAAYARALQAVDEAGDHGRLRFESTDKASAWLRAIAANLAVDDDRRRHGRGGSRRAAPVRATLDDEEAPWCADAGVDVEHDALDAVEREARRRLITRALERLAPEHRQVLRLRYADNLDPAAIMVLESLSRRQWDGRHTRALKALARALAGLPASAECRRTRGLLRRSPAALLRDGGGSRAARAHVTGCVACRAFAHSTRAALAALPLPIPIEAWRYAMLEHFRAGSRPATGPAAGDRLSPGAKAGAGAGAAKLTVVLAVAAIAVGGAITHGHSRETVRGMDSRTNRAAAFRSEGAARWADHGSARTGLERSARVLAPWARVAGGGRPATDLASFAEGVFRRVGNH